MICQRLSRKLFSEVRLSVQRYKPFETEMCDWQSNFRKTMRLKDEPCQNAIEAANANLG